MLTRFDFAPLIHALSDMGMGLAVTLVISFTLLLIAFAIERKVPHARPPSPAHAWFNLRYTVLFLAVLVVTRPLVANVSWTITNAFGVGWIKFGTSFAGQACAFVCVLVVTDLLEYLFHRAQHTFGFLWKMHEFHHSAEHFDITLTYRNFWLEPLLKGMFLYPLVAILFDVPYLAGLCVSIVFQVNHHVAHMNLRAAPRRFGLIVSHPQYHRLHHSRHPRDYNKNFCDLLPLWDLLFGTIHRPEPGEFVDVGLESGAAAKSVLGAFLWPWSNRATEQVEAAPRG